MRLIGIQALLTLLKQRLGADAEAFGIGDGIAVSNAGVFAQSHGIGLATAISGTVGIAAQAFGIGAADGIGVTTGTVLGIGGSIGLGAASGVGSATGLVAATASASGIGAASAVGQALHTIEATASASGVGQSLGESPTEDDVPNGRLTLSTGVPVMTSTVTGATTVYFTPYKGNKALVTTDGINFVSQTLTQLSQTTADATKSPAAVAANSIYDMFVWSDGGTLRCTRGPAWSSDTSRGTGAGTSELQLVSGTYTNKNAITNGPGAGLGTYVGSIRSNGSSTIDWNVGGSASGGVAGLLGLWNYFNRVNVSGISIDSGTSYTYGTGTWREKRGGTGFQISFLQGLSEDNVSVSRHASITTPATSGSGPGAGIALDLTNVSDDEVYITPTAAVVQNFRGSVCRTYAPQIGWHFIAGVEFHSGSSSSTFNVNSENLCVSLPM